MRDIMRIFKINIYKYMAHGENFRKKNKKIKGNLANW
jgi:hypothetical protein